MNVAVIGLWHLGSVVATCAASVGHTVAAWDPDAAVVAGLNEGRPPVAEPGIASLARAGLDSGALQFVNDRRVAVQSAGIVWITFDTPVDDEDRADAGKVVDEVIDLFGDLADGSLVVVSSQLPVGTIARLEAACTVIRTSSAIFRPLKRPSGRADGPP